jgi:ABC-type amino acid transport substrate-binding protein
MQSSLLKLYVAALLLLGGCAVTSEDAEVPAGEYSREAIRIGVTPDYPPVLYKEYGQLCGIEVDLAEYVMDELSAPVELHEMPFHQLIPSLERGELDVIMSGLSVTPERAEKVRFVTPYMQMGQMALVRAADAQNYAGAEELRAAAVPVGTVTGSTSEEFVKEQMPGAQSKAFIAAVGAIDALRGGSVDIVVGDKLYVQLQAEKDATLVALPWLLTQEELAWAVSKDAASDELYEELDGIMRSVKASGDVTRIITEHMAMAAEAE